MRQRDVHKREPVGGQGSWDRGVAPPAGAPSATRPGHRVRPSMPADSLSSDDFLELESQDGSQDVMLICALPGQRRRRLPVKGAAMAMTAAMAAAIFRMIAREARALPVPMADVQTTASAKPSAGREHWTCGKSWTDTHKSQRKPRTMRHVLHACSCAAPKFRRTPPPPFWREIFFLKKVYHCEGVAPRPEHLTREFNDMLLRIYLLALKDLTRHAV